MPGRSTGGTGGGTALVSQVAVTERTGAGQLCHAPYLGPRRVNGPASVTREVAR